MNTDEAKMTTSPQQAASAEMVAAETRVRDILATGSVGDRMSALWKLYEATLPDKRDALVAALIGNLALASRRDDQRVTVRNFGQVAAEHNRRYG